MAEKKFDAVQAVENYRKAFAHREKLTKKSEITGCNLVLGRMKKDWHKWQGEDNLHEMAFGEPH